MCCNPEIITLPNKERKITQQTKKDNYNKKKLVIKSNEDQCSGFCNMTSVLSEYPTFFYQGTL
jgi:hypothetical protein